MLLASGAAKHHGDRLTPGVSFNQSLPSFLRYGLSAWLARNFRDPSVSFFPMLGLQVHHHTWVFNVCAGIELGSPCLCSKHCTWEPLSRPHWSLIEHIVIPVHVLLSKVHLFSCFTIRVFSTSPWQHCVLCCLILKTQTLQGLVHPLAAYWKMDEDINAFFPCKISASANVHFWMLGIDFMTEDCSCPISHCSSKGCFYINSSKQLHKWFPKTI